MFQLLIVGVISQKLDIDNGEGGVLKDLPCVMRFNQLYCSEPGTGYPSYGINKYVDDNKVRDGHHFHHLSSVTPGAAQEDVRRAPGEEDGDPDECDDCDQLCSDQVSLSPLSYHSHSSLLTQLRSGSIR